MGFQFTWGRAGNGAPCSAQRGGGEGEAITRTLARLGERGKVEPWAKPGAVVGGFSFSFFKDEGDLSMFNADSRSRNRELQIQKKK